MAFDFSLPTNIFTLDNSKKLQTTNNMSSQVSNANQYSYANNTTKNLSLIMNSPYANGNATASTPLTQTPQITIIPTSSNSATPSFSADAGTGKESSLMDYLLIGGLIVGGIIVLPKLVK